MFKEILLTALLLSAFHGIQTSEAKADAIIPCETMLRQLRTGKADARISDADMTKVVVIENKGIERCNADDDKRADDFFAQALKILGK
ncbi:hypothetical protein FHS85_004952 [Rhodoligotrophos appendicifer]|uniref:hypothetical protein n=1 Tax=Rhodoligotrophos appendicifer TaxID=987056 RepID=UPI0011853431|nr:hypothetical protein [Rhodoligotrophos appendicifer]